MNLAIPLEIDSGRALGLGKKKIRSALFDPYAENAVVLYHPPQMTAHEELHQKEDEKLVCLSSDVEKSGFLGTCSSRSCCRRSSQTTSKRRS